MSAITPSTNVKLLKLPLELDNENQLTFSSVSAQYNYFNSLPSLAANNFTYQRKDGVIRFPGCIDDLLQYNYVMYQNSAFGNKWFYAYIDKMTFVSPEMTDISIRTDAFQTWQFDITFLESFVEREHVSDDTPGLHTVPEGLEFGEAIVENAVTVLDVLNATDHGGSSSDVVCCVVGVTDLPGELQNDPLDPNPPAAPTRIYNGIVQGLQFYAFKNASDLEDFILMYNRAGKNESIAAMFMCPVAVVSILTFATTWKIEYTYHDQTYTVNNVYVVWQSNGGYDGCEISAQRKSVHPKYRVVSFEPNETRVYSLNGYEFKNNKLLTYPYSYVNITNNAGNNQVYKWEDFKLLRNQTTNQAYPSADFRTYASMSASPSTKIVPVDYKNRFGEGVNREPSYEYGLTGQKFPACSWTSDYYTNWLTQNAANIESAWHKTLINAITAPISSGITSSAASPEVALAHSAGTMISSVASVITSVEQILATAKTAAIHSDEISGNVNAGDINYSIGNSGFTIMVMSIKAEYAKIIDDFFSMYGYKVNSVKTPNITGRRNWNYVKTIRGKIHGLIPKEDLNTISGMLDNGVTFWHSPSTFLDYSQTNDII